MALDPGWRPKLRAVLAFLIPVPFLTRTGRTPLLVWLRSLTVFTPVIWAFFLSVLVTLKLQSPEPTTWLWFVIPASALADGLIIRWIYRKPSKAENPPQLASEYRARFFLGWALTQSVVLYGFVGVFISGAIWPYLLSLPFGLISLSRIAPTASRIARLQDDLRARGSPIDVLEALLLPASELPPPPRPHRT